ncbi:MAG TPA: SDR family NAD(P)-dependent oxidoreductase [Steroidobacteraceae bacterium]|jgi:WW domain-containing oxidoreductase|nr:SDR family NAD(P)-dependent oxidoreductase [Steroidobacteraceae bacterium]
MSLYTRLALRGPDGFGYRSTAEEVTAGLSLATRRILITGCNSGLGLEALRVLALRGAHVFGAARTLEKAQSACAAVGGGTSAVACELTDPGSVAGCIATVRSAGPLDAVICNAGIMAPRQLQQAHGYELQFFANHIGHFMLVTGLLDHLTAQGRIVMVSSTAHRRAPREGIQFDNLSGEHGYRPFTAYGQSKLANLLFAKELARRLGTGGRSALAVHPGVIATHIGRHLAGGAELFFALGSLLFFKNIPQGAATQCFAAVHPRAAALSGAYLADCQVTAPRADAQDPALARRLWEVSEQIVARLH